MRKIITALLGGFCTLATLGAQAQYTFTTLAPYTQNFDGLTTGTAAFSGGTFSGTPGIILGYQYTSTVFAGFTGNVTANDGSNTGTAAYNFGTVGASDRALGGIAGGFSGNSGVGFICIRLLNSTGVTIKNLDVRYAIEQWYNSSKTTNANFEAAYRKYASGTYNANDIVSTSGWTAVPELNQEAPATGGLIGTVDGNSTTYRRTAQKRLLDVNLANGEEVVVRLKYIFNPDTNGNGISVDDVTIYPETNVLYSSNSGKLNEAGTWSQNTDNSSPLTSVDFTAANYTYFVRGNNTASRLSGAWNVTGTGSRVVVGTEAAPAIFTIANGDKLKATLDVGTSSTLRIIDPLASSNTDISLTLGSAGAGSSVVYAAAASQGVLAGTYARLRLAGTNSPKFPRGNVTVTDSLSLSQYVTLGTTNLTLLRGAKLGRSTGGQVLASSSGSLRQTVPGGGATTLLFPMALGSASADYLPVTITAGSTDKDETYRVQLVNNLYTTYSTTGTTPATYANSAGSTTAPTTDNLAATWYIGHETTTPVAATVQVGWLASASREGNRFAARRSDAYLDHYSSGTNTWDGSPADRGATNTAGVWYVTRTNVSKFSPFAVTVNGNGPLPVQLTRFEASRAGTTVACSWTTASELNNSHFEVERSLDGVAFTTLGRVDGQGSSASAHSYRFVDARPLAGPAYYRLRQVDVDGTASFSAVVAVAGGPVASGAVAALPNPGPGRFELQANFEAAGTVQATVLDVLGQVVVQASYPVAAGTAALPLDLSAQPAGVYLVRLQGAGTAATVRLLKQ